MQELLRKIQQMIENLPQAQRLVAEYVLKNYKDIPFMSITSLAKAIGVSDTTVIKFCISLDFDGFSGFKKYFATRARSEVTMYKNFEERLQYISDDNTMDRIITCCVNNVEVTLNNPINRENFEPFLQMLAAAKNIYVYGLRTSSMQAHYFADTLRLQNYPVFYLPENGHFIDQLCQMTTEDLFVGFAFSRYSTHTVKAIKYLTKNAIKCVSFTDATTSPTYGLSNLSFICESRSFSYQASYLGCYALIDAIITTSAMRRKDETTAHLKKLEDALHDFDVFTSYDMENGNF